jgi:hypothetical protein
MTPLTLTPLAALRPTDLPADLASEAKRLANDRKIVRLLDPVSMPPFVAALSTLHQAGALDLARLALYMVSECDYESPEPPASSTGTFPLQPEVARHYYENGNPAAWLRSMPNSCICQTSIASGAHGPNLHLVGGGMSVRHALLLADAALRSGQASAALIVAYSPTGPAPLFSLPDVGAAALALGPADGVEVVVDLPHPGGEEEPSALDYLVDVLDRVER